MRGTLVHDNPLSLSSLSSLSSLPSVGVMNIESVKKDREQGSRVSQTPCAASGRVHKILAICMVARGS